ncbi:MAG: hypothetical protein R2733_19615 [Acidimicrobiales bacterium]
MNFASPELDPGPDGGEPSGARPMLATLVGILLSLVALGVILVRLFPSSTDDEAIAPTSSASMTEVATSVTSEPATTSSVTVTTPTSTSTALETSTTSPPPPAEVDDEAPAILDLAMDEGSTTADVSFTTSTCVNARYDYSGPTSGRHEGEGYPDTTSCWTEHLAKLGEWTDALVPGSDYEVIITVIDASGRTATTTVDFTTAS